jgi:hypothetical protein
VRTAIPTTASSSAWSSSSGASANSNPRTVAIADPVEARSVGEAPGVSRRMSRARERGQPPRSAFEDGQARDRSSASGVTHTPPRTVQPTVVLQAATSMMSVSPPAHC